jgi:hypothetical protein
MGKTVFLELNLAVVYGFGLIILAVVRVDHNLICTRFEKVEGSTRGWRRMITKPADRGWSIRHLCVVRAHLVLLASDTRRKATLLPGVQFIRR